MTHLSPPFLYLVQLWLLCYPGMPNHISRSPVFLSSYSVFSFSHGKKIAPISHPIWCLSKFTTSTKEAVVSARQCCLCETPTLINVCVCSTNSANFFLSVCRQKSFWPENVLGWTRLGIKRWPSRVDPTCPEHWYVHPHSLNTAPFTCFH